MRYNRSRDGLTLIELIVTLTIISLFGAVLMMFLYDVSVIARQRVLQIELKSFRQSLILYQATKGEYPEDLKVFLQAKHQLGTSDEVIFGKYFLSGLGRDKEGYPQDAFGNRFYYDANTGEIHSNTKGYESW